jgi:cytidylate kinase
MRSLSEDLEKRDDRDITRKNSPLSAAKDAIVIDTTSIEPEAVIKKIIKLINKP